jgi:hypothetical protein
MITRSDVVLMFAINHSDHEITPIEFTLKNMKEN